MKPPLLAASLIPLVVLSALACSSAARSQPGIVARSRLGNVTAEELDRYIATRPGGTAEADASRRRQRLEELLALRAAESEGAERLGQPEVAAGLQRRTDEALLAEARKRLEAEAQEAAAATVTPEAVDAAYAATSSHAVEQLRLRHIFKRLSRNADANERTQVERAMERIGHELEAGADFGSLAKTHSDSQTASFDGLMAPVAKGDLDPALEETLWEAGAGGAHGHRAHVGGTPDLPTRRPGDEARPGPGGREARDPLAAHARGPGRVHPEAPGRNAKAGGADVRPRSLDDPLAAEDTVAAVWPGGEPLTVGEVFRSWSALPFAIRRRSDLHMVLEETVSRRLLLDSARRDRLDERPEVAAQLREVRRTFLAGVAQERRAEALTASLGEDELRRLYETERQRFERREARRVRGVVIRLPGFPASHAVFDEIDLVARSVRAGERDLADTARAMSQDPSRRVGGDLGWAEAEQLATWAGSRVSAAVMAASPGELVGRAAGRAPTNTRRLVYVPEAYLLARVEEVRPAGPAPFADVRSELPQLYRSIHAADIGRRMRADLLASIDAVLVERP